MPQRHVNKDVESSIGHSSFEFEVSLQQVSRRNKMFLEWRLSKLCKYCICQSEKTIFATTPRLLYSAVHYKKKLITCLFSLSLNPVLIRLYHHKWGWLDLLHSNSNLSNSHSPSRLIHSILLLQTNTFAFLLHLHLPCLLWSSLLPLVLHFKLQQF